MLVLGYNKDQSIIDNKAYPVQSNRPILLYLSAYHAPTIHPNYDHSIPSYKSSTSQARQLASPSAEYKKTNEQQTERSHLLPFAKREEPS